MKRTLLAILIIASGFFGMMRMKADVTTLDRERHTLINQQHQIQERIRILGADLALLKNPTRLKQIADKAGFQPITPLNFLTLNPQSMSEEIQISIN